MPEGKQYDLYFLNDYFDNDMQAIYPILKMYLEETPKELEIIESCLQSNNPAAAKAATHKIKTNVSMLSIRDKSNFVNDMHLLDVKDDITEGIRLQFMNFKSIVLSALQEMKSDFFEKQDLGTDNAATHIE
jgi:hypothetical protein